MLQKIIDVLNHSSLGVKEGREDCAQEILDLFEVPTVNIIHGGNTKYQIAREVWDEFFIRHNPSDKQEPEDYHTWLDAK